MSYQAYQQAQQSTETPRQIEYRLFSQVTRALVEAKDVESPLDNRLIEALDWNRRVWSHMSTDCGTDGNQHTDQLRAGIISLAIFVSKCSSDIMRGEESVDTLIGINRTIMEGLAMDPSVKESTETVQPAPTSMPTDNTV